MYRLPGAPFGPVHFTEYPLKPEYKDYTANYILAQYLLARTTKLTRYNQEGPWYVTKPCLFRDKYNFLLSYQMDMEPPVNPKPMPASAAKLPLDHTNKLFGIVYITLTGVIDTIVPATGLWLWVGKSMSYLIKLAQILWWALPTQSATCQFPNTSKLANQGWFPENIPISVGSSPNDSIITIKLKNSKLLLIEFESAQSIVFREVFGFATQELCFCFIKPSLEI
ncbi:hypothetical protein DSO57_1030921 [Entomophthora muscae]|uniref:Uncharacterized protein n=1 Tax=Entomophthora muscae TaxID=34485 RepID=A0ACC2TN13_9FUNG|nr:hypothetical protein DSO57_1030921 [Entomophthora muscae]